MVAEHWRFAAGTEHEGQKCYGGERSLAVEAILGDIGLVLLDISSALW